MSSKNLGSFGSAGGKQNAAAARIVLKTVEWALDMISDKLPCAQGCPTVGAALPQTEYLSPLGAGEHQALAQSGDAKKLSSLHLPRTQDHVQTGWVSFREVPACADVAACHHLAGGSPSFARSSREGPYSPGTTRPACRISTVI